MTVRSTCFLHAKLTSTNTSAQFPVPNGYTLIFKSWAASNFSGTPGDLAVYLGDGGTTTTYIYNATMAQAQIANGQIYVVLLPGMRVVCAHSGTGNIDVWLSGSLLVGVPPTTFGGQLPALPDVILPSTQTMDSGVPDGAGGLELAAT